MKIITLTGPSGCGKTTTLRIVYEMMKQKGQFESKAFRQEGADPKDFSDVIEYNNLKIGFLTMGDYANFVCHFLRYCNDRNCHIFITACNDRFTRPFNLIDRFSNNFIIKKTRLPLSRHVDDNTSIANTIFNLI